MPSLRFPSHAGIVVTLFATLVFGQQTSAPPSRMEPGELLRQTVRNEINSSSDGVRFMFRGTKTTPRVSTTKVYVETKEATAGMILAYNGKPLTPEQRQAEEARIDRFISNPEELRKKQRQEHDDAERTMRIVRAIPDAMLFEYDGEELGAAGVGKAGEPLIRLKFHPNPRYAPPSHTEQVLTGMEGVVLIDAKRCRIAKIDGTLFRDVGFGWGILGHLDKGGHFLVQQQEVANNRWEISRMSLQFTGKILLFKNLAIDSTEVYSDFRQVPSDLTFADAIEMLKKEHAVIAEEKKTSKLAESSTIPRRTARSSQAARSLPSQ
jgi:hypothetical protein